MKMWLRLCTLLPSESFERRVHHYTLFLVTCAIAALMEVFCISSCFSLQGLQRARPSLIFLARGASHKLKLLTSAVCLHSIHFQNPRLFRSMQVRHFLSRSCARHILRVKYSTGKDRPQLPAHNLFSLLRTEQSRHLPRVFSRVA